MFSIFAVVMAMFALTACSSSSAPSGVVNDAYDAFIEGDYAGYVDCLNQREGVTEEEREQFIEMLEMKGAQTLEEKGGIASYEIVSEELAEDGQSAIVKVKVIYGDGSEKVESNKVVKNAAGDWKLSLDK